MKRIVFETANSVGHIEVPDDFDTSKLNVNEEEPLLPPGQVGTIEGVIPGQQGEEPSLMLNID